MKIVQTNLRVLVAQKEIKDRRRISLLTLAAETGLNKNTIYGLANNTTREYPRDVLATLCTYFDCDICDLLFLADVPDEEGDDRG
jgi:putative transcriptional regulator